MKDSALLNTAEVALGCGIVVAVLFFGGTEPVSFAAVEVLLFGTAAWIIVKRATKPVQRPMLFAVPVFLGLWALLQICPVPAGMARVIGGSWIGTNGPTMLSLAPYQTRVELLVLLTCLVAFFLAVCVTGERKRRRRLAYVLVIVGVAEAFYGLVQYLANWQVIWWYSKKYDLQEATGTYINRNHFAGLLEMILPFAVCFALYEGEKLGFNRTHHVQRSRRAGPTISSASLWLAVAVVLMAALVFSRSRMGILAAIGSLIVVFSLNALQRRTVPVAIGLGFVVLSLSLAGWIGLRPALTRFEDLGQEMPGQQETRLSIWPGALKLIGEHPVIGNGLGTFPIAYTRYQTSFLGQYVNHAHNDYLEFASDLGIPAALVLFGSVVWFLIRATRISFRAESRFERNLSLACVGSIVAILLHSLTDFNLYIPANALVFAVILGLASPANAGTSPPEASA
jgi:O-antigen ligase